MEYILVDGYLSSGLNKEVNKRLQDGWTLYGFPYTNGGGYHFQAMTRDKK